MLQRAKDLIRRGWAAFRFRRHWPWVLVALGLPQTADQGWRPAEGTEAPILVGQREALAGWTKGQTLQGSGLFAPFNLPPLAFPIVDLLMAQAVAAILSDVVAFTGGKPLADDLTLLILGR